MDALQERVRAWTGLPAAAGIGSTKTLANVAQRHAKAIATPLVGLTTWSSAEVGDLLAETPVSEVWGVGSRLTRGLAGLGIHAAADLAYADAGVLRRRWSVVLERTARELAGVPCMPVGFTPKDRQQLMYSRMFGATVSTRSEMRSILAQYAGAAARSGVCEPTGWRPRCCRSGSPRAGSGILPLVAASTTPRRWR